MRSVTLARAAALLVAVVPAAAAAQGGTVSSSCAAAGQTADACQVATDLFTLLVPQLGTAMAGGAATPGQFDAIGRTAGFGITVRATGLRIDLPTVDGLDVSPGAPQQRTIETEEQWGGAPALDLELGVFPGIPLGITRVLAVDVIGTGYYLPDLEGDGVSLTTTGGRFRLGGGVRVGLLQESMVVPGVAVSYMRRGLPTINVTGESSSGDSISVNEAGFTADSYRITAGKGLGPLAVMVGAGRDTYDAEATITAVVREGLFTERLDPVRLSENIERWNYFAGLSLGLGPLRLAGEIGRTTGDDLATFNSFTAGNAGRARTYGSVAVRIGS